MKYRILSPDGFTIEHNKTYANITEAKTAFYKWVNSFQAQGYYSTTNREHIPLEDLPDFCELVELND